MPLFFAGAGVQSLGLALLNSCWQMGIGWLCFRSVIRLFRIGNPGLRHSLALLTLTGCAGWFFIDCFSPDAPAAAALVQQTFIWITPSVASQTLALITGLYLSLFGLRLCHRSWQYRQSYRHSTRLREPYIRMQHFVDDAQTRWNIRRKVRVFTSALITVPQTMGFWKPVILFPISLMSQLTTQQVEAILLHELAHIRRNDYLINLLVIFFKSVFFYNPFARLLIRSLEQERELDCDRMVLACHYPAWNYAGALLLLEKSRRQMSFVALAANGTETGLLLHRVQVLTGTGSWMRSARPARLVSGWLLAGAAFLFVVTQSVVRSPVLAPRRYIIMSDAVPPPALKPIERVTIATKLPRVHLKEQKLKPVISSFRLAYDRNEDQATAAPIESWTDQTAELNFSKENNNVKEIPAGKNIQLVPYVPGSSFELQQAGDSLTIVLQQQKFAAEQLQDQVRSSDHPEELLQQMRSGLQQRLIALRQSAKQQQERVLHAQGVDKTLLKQQLQHLKEQSNDIQQLLEKITKQHTSGIIYI